jgi:hypothetical protein
VAVISIWAQEPTVAHVSIIVPSPMGAEIDEGRHQHDARRDIGRAPDDAVRHGTETGLLEFGRAPAVELRGDLVPPHGAARSAWDHAHVVEAEREQHRLLQPLVVTQPPAFSATRRLAAIEEGRAPHRRRRAPGLLSAGDRGALLEGGIDRASRVAVPVIEFFPGIYLARRGKLKQLQEKWEPVFRPELHAKQRIGCSSALVFRRPRRHQHLVDPPPVHVDDFEAHVAAFDPVPGNRQPAEPEDDEAGDGFEVALVADAGEAATSSNSSIGIIPSTSHEPSAAASIIGSARSSWSNRAPAILEDVGRRDDALGRPVFVDHHGDAHALSLKMSIGLRTGVWSATNSVARISVADLDRLAPKRSAQRSRVLIRPTALLDRAVADEDVRVRVCLDHGG